ncbi:MAG TPA: DNA mismatch repair endonuclease MutL [Desulfobacteraceae bacterium]|nr:DNA mismatch repair endonuclease MutL [Desulfobacteraceae bacterium]
MIKILSESISNKVAAGEVVERPASVVKELLENALDAGGTRIIIDVEKGGRSLIRVADNGSGMTHDDALLSLERYATSKIFNESDLFSIKTLGFRGEAVPSMASVSKFYLETNQNNHGPGTSIFVDGGKIKKVTRPGAPSGTMVTVKQLFFNVPARRKFLKTINTEMAHISDITSKIALSHPGVHFKIFHNGKVIKDWSSVSDPSNRVADVLGKNMKNSFYQVEYKEGLYSVSGWISSSADLRATSRGLYIYVNGRFVRDKTVRHALIEGYAGRLMKGEFPTAVLFITLPHGDVDVNVHPAKNEVRFFQQKAVHDLVVKGVSSTIDIAEQPKWETIDTDYAVTKYASASDPAAGYVFEPPADYNSTRDMPGQLNIETRSDFSQKEIPAKKQTTFWNKKYFSGLRIIGQLHNVYILCESDEGLVLLDQHAAHERILFEQLKKGVENSMGPAQQLLVPETLELGFMEKNILEKILPDLVKAGFDMEPFGGNSFIIKAVPVFISCADVKSVILEVVETMAETGSSSGISSKLDQFLMLIACHSAIRAKQSLAHEQMEELLNQLDGCENPSRCPHGRPTWISLSSVFFEKSFKRIV